MNIKNLSCTFFSLSLCFFFYTIFASEYLVLEKQSQYTRKGTINLQ